MKKQPKFEKGDVCYLVDVDELVVIRCVHCERVYIEMGTGKFFAYHHELTLISKGDFK